MIKSMQKLHRYVTFTLLSLPLCSCTIYLVNVDKHIHINGDRNAPIMSGSALDNISADPTNDVKADATLTP